MSWIIYKHTNKLNLKCYIGQTKQDPERRWRNGEGYTCRGVDNHFSRAIKKYGWSNFWHEIIENNINSLEAANKRETFWINFYDSVNHGYNSNYGGDNRAWSEESKRKASKTRTGKKITGLHLVHLREAVRLSSQNPERNKKISQALKGRPFSEEHKEKISCFAKTRTSELNPFYGKHHSKDTKQKLMEVFGKKVICLETQALFMSANEAGQILGIDGANIRSSCRLGIQAKVGTKWFHFYYVNEPKPKFKYNNIKQVYNLETNEIFENLHEAGNSINKTSKLIGMCCRGKVETAGGYHWLYFKDYKSFDDIKIKSIMSKNIIGKGRKKKVICVETGVIYNSTCEASRKTNICQTSIAKCCQGLQETAGNFHWNYIK